MSALAGALTLLGLGGPAAAALANVPDTTPPTISIATPADGQVFTDGDMVASVFSCADPGGSGVASCTGPATVYTGTPGEEIFTVTATDQTGNTSSKVVIYHVNPYVSYGPIPPRPKLASLTPPASIKIDQFQDSPFVDATGHPLPNRTFTAHATMHVACVGARDLKVKIFIEQGMATGPSHVAPTTWQPAALPTGVTYQNDHPSDRTIGRRLIAQSGYLNQLGMTGLYLRVNASGTYRCGARGKQQSIKLARPEILGDYAPMYLDDSPATVHRRRSAG